MACNKLFPEVNDAYSYGIVMRHNCLRSTRDKIKRNQVPKQGQPLCLILYHWELTGLAIWNVDAQKNVPWYQKTDSFIFFLLNLTWFPVFYLIFKRRDC